MRGKQQGSLLIKVFGILIVGAIVLSAYYLYLAKTKLQKEKLPKPVPIENVVKQMEKDGVLLKLDRTDTLAGIDADNNGIRDDIDEYIRQTFKDEAQRKAVEQLAKALQNTLLINIKNKNEVYLAREKATKSIDCIFKQFDDFNVGSNSIDEIVKRSFNTKKRVEANLKFDEALSGSVWGLHQGEVCDE